MKLIFTLYKNKFDKRGEPVEGAWSWWVENYFSIHAVTGTPDLIDADKKTLDVAKDGPAIVLGKIPKGMSHEKENVIALYALALDIDGRSDEEAAAALAAIQDYHYALYTTYKHGAKIAGGRARLRVIVPLAAPIPRAKFESEHIWHRFNQLVGGINDPSTKDANRLHFLPATFDASLAEAWHNEGRDYLSVDELPVYVPKVKPKAALSSAEEGDIIQRIRRRALCVSAKVEGEALSGAFKALLRGDSLAAPGHRHDTLRDMTWWISKKERTLSESILASLFGPSISVMEAESETPWDGMAEVLRSYKDAVEKRNTIAIVASGSDNYTPYTQEELEKIAATQGVTIDDLQRRWIVEHGNSYFFLQENGFYSKPANGPFEGRAKAKQILKRSPVVMDEPSQNGIRKRAITDIIEDYGWVADNLMIDLTAAGSWFDAEESTIHEATCPLRVLEPEYDPQIAEWLHLLSGDHHERFLDWLAVFPDLTRLSSGLYIKGKKGAGKSLFCNGLARLWTKGGCTSLRTMFANFNDKASTCPLVVADEQMPVARRNEDTTATLREILGNTEHEVNRKFRNTTTMHGALRVILTANNGDLLRGNVTGPDDQAAMIERFLILDAPKTASKYLSKLGGLSYLDQRWRVQDGIAKHVLHLAMTREVRGDRFAVAGVETATHRHAFTSGFGLLVREWLVKFCDSPTIVEQHPQLRILIQAGNGEFLVNSEAIKLGWQMYLGMHVREEPRLTAIGRALAVMAPSASMNNGKSLDHEGRVQRVINGKRLWFYEIDPMHLVEFSREHMIGSEDAIVAVVDRPRKGAA